MVTFIVIFLVLLCLGLVYTVYGIYTAEEDKFNIEEPFDEKTFSKPSGWKVGKMPKGWISQPPVKKEKIVLQEQYCIKKKKPSVWDRYPLLKKMSVKLTWFSKSSNTS